MESKIDDKPVFGENDTAIIIIDLQKDFLNEGE
jgi:hypothetical protein